MSSEDVDTLEYNHSYKKDQERDSSRDDLTGIGLDFLEKIPIKKMVYLFLICISVMNELFVQKILKSIPNTIDDSILECANFNGTIIQIVVIVILYAFVDIMIDNEII